MRRFGGPPGGFARPENAIRRSEELIAVGQKHAALQTLHDIITSKKHRTWSKTYETIMFNHIDLCVESKKRNYAKEALSAYRNMCQVVNIASLEEVIKYFLKRSGEKAEEAQSKAAAAAEQLTIDVADLEEDTSPEDLMLSYVSADKGKDRTEREQVTPWFRFLWESYRTVLDILRINPKLEGLYSLVATKAFSFCLQFKRNAEFRRLCDILRQHLNQQLNRFRENRMDATTPESLQLHLETRFEQLKVACELELWAEAFRSVEDIQQLILLGKKNPKQQLMATYYARLTQIFAVSEDHTYAAYSWLKLFNFTKAFNKNVTSEDMTAMASSVVLSTLSILPYDRLDPHMDEVAMEQDKERITRMANILGFPIDAKKDYRQVLSRAALLQSTTSSHIMGLVPSEVRQLHDLLTSDFNPLELCSKMTPLLEKLNELTSSQMSPASPIKEVTLSRYVSDLKQVAVLRLVKQISEVYSSLQVSSLAAMVPWASFGEVESLIVDAVRHDYLQVRIDHRAGTLHFGSHQLESEKVRGHLSTLASRLAEASVKIDASLTSMGIKPPGSDAREAKRAAAIQVALERSEEEHRLMIARKIMIEKRKEEQELALVEQEKEEERRRLQIQKEAEAAEEKRRREDATRREIERMEREKEEAELEEIRKFRDAQLAKKGVVPGAGPKAALPLVGKDGEKLDKNTMMQQAMEEKMKEQQEMERKLAKAGRILDHFERARREEEGPYLEEAYKKKLVDDEVLFKDQQVDFAKAHRAAWELDIVEKAKLSSMMADKALVQALIMARREEEFVELKAERERLMTQRREQKKRERDLARRREFVKRCSAQIAARVSELEAAAKREAEAKLKEAREEERRKADEILERQRQREAEIEAKRRGEKVGEAMPSRPLAAPVAASSAAMSSGAFVPPHLRSRGGGGGDSAPPPKESGDRWGGGGAAAAPGAPKAAEDKWKPAGGAREESAPAPAPSKPADAPAPAPSGKFIPRHLRG